MATGQLQEKTYGRLRAITIATRAILSSLQEELEKQKREEREWTRQFQEVAADHLQALTATTQAQLAAIEDELDEDEWRFQLQEMTEEQLQSVVATTPAQQALLEEELEEREWDRILAQPSTQLYIEKLGEELDEDIAAGRIREWKPGESLEDLFQS